MPSHVSDYLDSDLDRDRAARVDRHLAQCPECRELLRSLRALVGALGTIRDEPTDRVAEVLVAAVKSRLGKRPPAER